MEKDTCILIVDDSHNWRGELTRILSPLARIIAVGSLAEARQVFSQEPSITQVITDGLEGDWQGVCELAQECGIPVTVFSSSVLAETVTNQAIPFIDKKKVSAEKLPTLIHPRGE